MIWGRTGLIALRVAEIAALLSLSVFLLSAADLMEQARTDGHALAEKGISVGDRAEAAIVDFRRVVLSVGGTAAEIRKTSITTREAALEQRALLREAMARAVGTLRDADETVRSLNETVQATNANMNGKILPQISQMAADASSKFNLLADDAHEQIGKLGKVQDNLALATAGIARTANDPNIAKTFANVEGATSDVKQTADYYHRKLTAPGNFTWNIFKAVVHFGGDAANVYQVVH